MKRMKKLASLLLAMVMVLSMAGTVLAEQTATAKDEGSFTITLNNDQSGHTYSAYQIFKGDLLVKAETGTDGKITETKVLSNIEWGDGVVAEGLIAKLKADSTMRNAFEDLADNATAADVAEVLARSGNDSEFAQAFADVIGQNLKNDQVAGTSSELKDTNEKTTGYVIKNLTAGYYLVRDTGHANEHDAFTRYILQVVANVNADVKTSVPSIDKKIVEGSELVEANNAGVGKVVSYEITGRVPDWTGYDTYYYVINDTLSNGLTFNRDVTVKVGENVLTECSSATNDGDYYLYTGEDAAPYTFRIAFVDITKFNKNAGITVNYSATVNANAVIGDAGNTNKVNLIYSNDPNSENKGVEKPGIPDSEVPTGKSPDDITTTYVAEIDITKTDENNAPLAGAEFTLTGTSVQTVMIERTYYEISENGEYYLLKNGTYTETAPQKEEKNEDGTIKTESNENLYASIIVRYEKKTANETNRISTSVKMTAVSDAEGKIVFKGLGEGTYTIEETGVPAGYNKAENMTVVVECQEPTTITTGEEKATWILGNGTSAGVILNGDNSGKYEMTIVNKSGMILPSTGGMGTTIFYVIGSILVIGAVILLVTRKRMSREE